MSFSLFVFSTERLSLYVFLIQVDVLRRKSINSDHEKVAGTAERAKIQIDLPAFDALGVNNIQRNIPCVMIMRTKIQE
jgi:hypothetical protein